MSVTDEYVLISWHAGEQNSDLLLGPGSELSELDILETKAVCSEPPFISANRGCWRGSHHNDHFDIPTYVVTHIPTCSHHWSILPSSSFAFPSSVGCVHLPFLRGYPGGNNLYMYPLSDPWWCMPEKSHIYLSMIKSKTRPCTSTKHFIFQSMAIIPCPYVGLFVTWLWQIVKCL